MQTIDDTSTTASADTSFGCIPYRRHNHQYEFLLVHHRHDSFWAFPKGHAEKNETPLQTAQRELAEETGITTGDIDPSQSFDESYDYPNADGGVVHKTVTYYPFHVTGDGSVTVQDAEIIGYQWCTADTALETITHVESKNMFREFLKYLEP